MLEIHDVIEHAKRAFPHALFVSTTGFITRDLLEVQDDARNFYLVGSMGMAAPIGLGLALAQPSRQVVVLDGDGSFAMNPGALLSVGTAGVRLIHIVLDNGAHASTGGQRTVAVFDPVGIAIASGYAQGSSVNALDELQAVTYSARGATLIHAVCAPRSRPIGGRLQLTPQELVTRFQMEIGVARP